MLMTDSVLMDVEEKQLYPIIIGSMQIYPIVGSVSRTIDSEESGKDATVDVNGSDDIEQPLSSAGEEDNVCNNELIEVETLNGSSKQPLLSAGEEECVDNVSNKVEIVNGSSEQPDLTGEETIANSDSTDVDVETMNGSSKQPFLSAGEEECVDNVSNKVEIVNGSSEQPDLTGEETIANSESTDVDVDTMNGSSKQRFLFAGEEECVDNASTKVEIVNGSSEQPLAGEETIANSESTDVETMNGSSKQPLSHAGEVESVSESTEVETMNGESEIIEPVCHAIEQESASNGESAEVDVMIGSSKTASPGELGSVSNDEFTEVGVANTSSKSETVKHLGELRGVSTLSNWGNKPNFTSARVVRNVRRQPIVQQSFPRDNDDKIGENIGFALLELDEMNRKRDALRMEVETKKITSNEYRDKYEVTKSVQSIAYDVLNAKRQELDSVQSTLNMIKNAVLVKETGDKVLAIQYRLEHETIYSIQEEKQLMREMKQLTAYHQELQSIVERQTEPQPSFDEKKPLEKRLKALKEELDSAKKELSRIKPLTNAARKVYFDENEKLKEMQGQFKSANVFCQEAYANVRNFKSQLYKNKYFQMYKDDDFKNKYLRSNPTSTHALNATRRKVEDNKVFTPSASTEIKPALHSQEMVKEDNKHSQEEEELPKEEKVLLKEIFAVKSREEFVAEEKAKAKEAEERKKRYAKKAKLKAGLMEQREAESKAKKKAKRDRKKARKAGIVEVELLVPISEDPSLEPVTQELPEISEKPTLNQELLKIKKKPWSKKPKKTSVLAKTKMVSPPLPNKNKKPMRLWKWVILSTPLVVAAAVAILADPVHILL